MRARIYKYWFIWTLIGFPIGCLLYLVINLFNAEANFWMTSLMTAGYTGFFVGVIGGCFYIARNG